MIGLCLMRCRAGDGGRSSVVALQEGATNHHKVRRLRAIRAERCGKRRVCERVRCDSMKASESEPRLTCRNAIGDIKSGSCRQARDEPGGCLFIGQVVSGMHAARARVRLLYGTWEPVVSCDGRPVADGLRSGVSGKVSGDRSRERRIPVAGHRVGPADSSDEGPVMGLERSGRAIQTGSLVNHDVCVGGING
jgi:hypothetical protein